MVYNNTVLRSDPQWTQVKGLLGHESIIDSIISDKALMKTLSRVFVDITDKGCSDHYLVGFDSARTRVRRRKK